MIFHIDAFAAYRQNENSTPAVAAALSELSEGDTLCLDGRELHFWPEGAKIGYYAISNNDAGDKPTAFLLTGRKNITIDGGGAKLIFHGRILPFILDRSEGITLRDLTIDYSSPYYAQPRIIEADEQRTVLRFDSPECGCRVKDGHFSFYSRVDGWECDSEAPLTLEFSPVTADLLHPTDAPAIPSATKPPYFPYCGKPKDHGFLGGMFRDVKLTELADDTIEMRGQLGFVHTVGAYLVMTHSTREFPGIFVNESKDVTLSDIRLSYTSGMGVIAQMSENLILDKVVAKAVPGRLLSVNADATHFVCCRGKLSLRDCKFTNMMDDACNIHGIYGIITGSEENNRLKLGFGHHQQRGIRFLAPGDRAAIIDRREAKTLYVLTVSDSTLKSADELCLTFAEALPEELMRADFTSGDYLVENLSASPEVTISRCESGYNRPRGFLISTAGKTIIEDCTFYNMNTGVQIGGEMVDWYESGAVSDVTIRNCRFDDSAYAGGVAISAEPRLMKVPDEPFHGRISIENNRFIQHEPRILRANSVGELCFTGNRFIRNDKLAPHPQLGEKGISVDGCGKVKVENPEQM